MKWVRALQFLSVPVSQPPNSQILMYQCRNVPAVQFPSLPLFYCYSFPKVNVLIFQFHIVPVIQCSNVPAPHRSCVPFHNLPDFQCFILSMSQAHSFMLPTSSVPMFQCPSIHYLNVYIFYCAVSQFQ